MPNSKILSLSDHRRRRESRLARARLLYAPESELDELAHWLERALLAVGGDRIAAVWVQEYGGNGNIHPYCLIDLASETPRRGFPLEPLQIAWRETPPNLVDTLNWTAFPSDAPLDHQHRFTVVSLGTQGLNAWFMVLESPEIAGPLDQTQQNLLMYFAGRCRAVILHDDIGPTLSGPLDECPIELQRKGGFAGWTVLKDLDGLDIEEGGEDDHLGHRIGSRFLITRFIRSLVDDAMIMDHDLVLPRVEALRTELEKYSEDDQERRLWSSAVDAAVAANHGPLAESLLSWGELVETEGHLNGAWEIYRTAYDVTAGAADISRGIEAARFGGRVLRKLGCWDESIHWYDAARAMAEHLGSSRTVAAVLDGVGNTYRQMGNFPKAERVFNEVLDIGLESQDTQVEAWAFHGLLTVEKHRGKLPEAAVMGWRAYELYSSTDAKTRALYDLAGVLYHMGELDAARDAYEIIIAGSAEYDHRVMSLADLALIFAQQGSRNQAMTVLEELDGHLKKQTPSVALMAQILQMRGETLLALGYIEASREWLHKALAYSKEVGVTRTLIEVGDLLQTLSADSAGLEVDAGKVTTCKATLPNPSDPEILRVRQGLGQLREALTSH